MNVFPVAVVLEIVLVLFFIPHSGTFVVTWNDPSQSLVCFVSEILHLFTVVPKQSKLGHNRKRIFVLQLEKYCSSFVIIPVNLFC